MLRYAELVLRFIEVETSVVTVVFSNIVTELGIPMLDEAFRTCIENFQTV